MAFLENGINGRDKNNCSLVDARIVWEVRATLTLDVCKSEWNEVVKTGEKVNEERVYHFLAPPSLDAIKLLWAERMRYNVPVVGEPTFTPLCRIDGAISYEHL